MKKHFLLMRKTVSGYDEIVNISEVLSISIFSPYIDHTYTHQITFFFKDGTKKTIILLEDGLDIFFNDLKEVIL